MTYDWNKMVEITVPVGINGWVYAGSVTINGVTVDFPIGIPTSVPEPVAELLKMFIALEEDKNKVPEQGDGGGGGGIVFVNVAIGDQKDDANGEIYAVEYDVISIDKTFDELKEAINRGSLVQLNAQKTDDLESYYLQLVSFGNDTISFAAVMLGMQMVCRVMKSEFDAANVKTACDIGIVQ